MRRNVTEAELRAKLAELLQSDESFPQSRLPKNLVIRKRRPEGDDPNWTAVWMADRIAVASSGQAAAIHRAVAKAEAQYDVLWDDGRGRLQAPPSQVTDESPLGYAIAQDLGLVTFSGDRTATMIEFRDILTRIVEDDQFRPGFGFLRDRRALPMMPRELFRQAVDQLAQFRELGGSRWAIVVGDHGSAESFDMMSLPQSNPIVVRTFADVDQAKLWLAASGGR
jgi:hypothetical protein